MELSLSRATVLIGRNGAGKSTILKALRLFYENGASNLIKEDFFDGDDSQPIMVRLTWSELPEAASERFSSYIDDDQLRVAYVVKTDERGRLKGTYKGYRRQHPPFAEIRDLTGAKAQTKQFGELIEDDPLYEGLVKERAARDNLRLMAEWESEHPEHCELIEEDATQFFGTAGGGDINTFTSFIYVPAVRDASNEGDETGDKSSGLKALMDKLVRETIMRDEGSKRDLERIDELAKKIYGDQTHPHLDRLSDSLSNKIDQLAPGSTVTLQWAVAAKATLSAPSASVFLTEDGYEAPLDHVGHGLQRAYILSVLQQLSELSDEEIAEPSATILGIEEPELYQHPNRQRHLADVLQELSRESAGIQVIYSTHSPLFVSVAELDSVRRLTKVTKPTPARTAINSSTLSTVSRELARIEGGSVTPECLKGRLRDVIRPWISEGFFADGVVLVEGGSDRAALLGLAKVRGEGFAKHGISILPVDGKNNLLSCTLVFRSLGIQTFSIWDCDDPGPEPDRAEDSWMKWNEKRRYNEKVHPGLAWV